MQLILFTSDYEKILSLAYRHFCNRTILESRHNNELWRRDSQTSI